MRSKSITIRVPGAVAESLELRLGRGELGDYPNRNACIVGLLRFPTAFPKPHSLTVDISKKSAADQDKIDDFILECVKEGVDVAELLGERKPATADDFLELARQKKQKRP